MRQEHSHLLVKQFKVCLDQAVQLLDLVGQSCAPLLKTLCGFILGRMENTDLILLQSRTCVEMLRARL